MKLIGLARIGRDAELRSTGQDSVLNLALAFNYGKKGADGNRPTQWVEGALWGKRADALAQYLVKGQQVLVTLSEAHIETYEGKSGTGSKLVGRIDDIEFAGSAPGNDRGSQDSQRQQAPQQNPRRQPERSPGQRSNPGNGQAQQRQQPQAAQGFDDFDSDVPF